MSWTDFISELITFFQPLLILSAAIIIIYMLWKGKNKRVGSGWDNDFD